MDKFGYGIAFNITLLKTADKKELSFLKITPKQRETLVDKNYVLQQTDALPTGMEAQYNWLKIGNKSQDVFKYRSGLENKTLNDNIGLAGHEMYHAAGIQKLSNKKSWTNFISRNANDGIRVGPTLRKNAGLLVGEAYFAALGHFGDFNSAVAMPVLAGTIIGGKIALGNSINYNEEVNAYRYQEKLGSMLMKPNAAKVRADLDAAKQDQSTAVNLKDRFIAGYPGIEKRELIRLEQQQNYLDNGAGLFTSQRIDDIHKITQYNMSRSGGFAIKYI